MRTFSTLSAFVALVNAALAQQALFINTPASLVECQPALLNFGGGSGAPYFISALPAGQVSASPLLSFPQQSSTSYTWTVNLPAGTNISLSIRDSSGAVQYASAVAIQAGTSSACLDAAGASSASAAGAISTGAASSAAAMATTAGASIAVSSAASSTLVSSAPSATVTAAAGVPTSVTQANGTMSSGSSYNFTCGPTQGDLTYGITTAVLAGVPLSQAVDYFRNWTAAVPGVLTNSTGMGVGANRTFTASNLTFSETLRLNMTNATSGALHQQWNSSNTNPLLLPDNLVLYSSFDDLTVYTNATTNQTSIQYFILGCFSDQATGLTAIASFIESAITYFASQLNGTNATSTMAATPARRMVKLF